MIWKCQAFIDQFSQALRRLENNWSNSLTSLACVLAAHQTKFLEFCLAFWFACYLEILHLYSSVTFTKRKHILASHIMREFKYCFVTINPSCHSSSQNVWCQAAYVYGNFCSQSSIYHTFYDTSLKMYFI